VNGIPCNFALTIEVSFLSKSGDDESRRFLKHTIEVVAVQLTAGDVFEPDLFQT
jgi:hypothetical protein